MSAVSSLPLHRLARVLALLAGLGCLASRAGPDSLAQESQPSAVSSQAPKAEALPEAVGLGDLVPQATALAERKDKLE
ncbi:MAG: hypothetical protein IH608_12585 [Proteobacteria bacterium]|nr:hypothetical protein [Pseudomonadota bacterium]